MAHDHSARRALAQLMAPGGPLARLAGLFADAGEELFLVGGSVRDLWLGRSYEDLDLATTAAPDKTLELVRGEAEAVWLQGFEFGTVAALLAGVRVEMTTLRAERYEAGSRHPEVSFARDITADLARRDFTINALAVRLADLELIDPYGGVDDIATGVIRTPLEPSVSFADDPLRMLRAFRFASQLGFRIDPATLDGIEKLRHQLEVVSAERIRDELTKLLLGRAPATALAVADSVGLTELFLPELTALKLEQDPVHKHKDVFLHTLAVVDRAPLKKTVRLAALLHDIGKPSTRRIEPTGVSFHLHEVVGAKMARERLRALRYPKEVVADVTELIRLHHRFHTYRQGWTDSAVRRYARDAGPLLADLNALVRADCTTRNPARARRLAARLDELEARIAELAKREELAKLRPDLDGAQVMAFLGVAPGPVVGKALAHLLELRIEEGPLGEDEAFRRLAEWARGEGIEPAGVKLPPAKPRD